ncbi:putative ABC transport system permease protein [Motilibacter rhizosphaerae]|uniref:Putative ABC transport system permease protein n=1 Tax=Motilibacter rhizosphaerae TaxID=598652 RepID=A0A4Q7NSU0_9ACTN|nr:putative ABC transport system permease protein [Motilibacter rhizosphaerae]
MLLTAVLVGVAVSAPLDVAAAGEATWRHGREALDPSAVSATVVGGTRGQGAEPQTERLAHLDALSSAVSAAGRDAGLGDALELQTVEPVSVQDPAVPGPKHAHAPVVLVSRTSTSTSTSPTSTTTSSSAEANLHLVAGRVDAAGVLVPQDLADQLHLRPGDRMTLAGSVTTRARPAGVTVSGIYVRPAAPLAAYWAGLGLRFFLRAPGRGDEGVVYPPAPVIAAPALLDALAGTIDSPVDVEWSFPAPRTLDLATAERTASAYARLAAAVAGGRVTEAALPVGDPPVLRTSLPGLIADARRTTALLSPPVRAVGVGGAAAALVLVGAWAAASSRRREVQLRGLLARGLRPAEAAGRAARAAVPAVLLGAVLGTALGWAGVSLLGPARVRPDTATAAGALLAAVAALVVVAVVTAALVARLDRVDAGRLEQRLGRVPWLPVLSAVAAVAALPLLHGSGTSTGTSTGGAPLGAVALAVPLLVVGAGAGLAVTALQRLAPRALPALDRLPTGAFLAARRVLAAPGAARLVVVACAVALGLSVYASALADSSSRTLRAKAAVAVGADAVVSADDRVLPALPAGTSAVLRDPQVSVASATRNAALLALDPETFAAVATWDTRFGDRDRLLHRLAGAPGSVPVVIAGDATGLPSTGAAALQEGPYTLQVQVVARVPAFPGMLGRGPLVVVAQQPLLAALAAHDPSPRALFDQEVWVRGDSAPAQRALGLTGSGAAATTTTTAGFLQRPDVRSAAYALAYLRAVAGAGGALGLLGLVLHAAGQQRRRTVATVLLDRMGLGRAAGRTAAALELGLLAGTALVCGCVLALPACAFVLGRVDPVPAVAPAPLFRVPALALLAVVVGTLAAVVLGALLVDRLARRAPAGTVMRAPA